jgi:hypothetical protein
MDPRLNSSGVSRNPWYPPRSLHRIPRRDAWDARDRTDKGFKEIRHTWVISLSSRGKTRGAALVRLAMWRLQPRHP